MLAAKLALRNLRSDWFGTLCAVLGVALGTATVNVVLVLDENTRAVESTRWTTNPDLDVDASRTVAITAIPRSGAPAKTDDAKKETHEDYQVMRTAIRLGSLSAFLVGALIVFFTFRVIIVERRREIALLRSLGSTPEQVAGIFLLEAALVGAIGALAGFLLAPPLSFVAARFGITTTGRDAIGWLWFPWRKMLAVSAIGALTAMLGVVRPLWDVLRLDVARTLRPAFIEGAERKRRGSGVLLIALPFMALLYLLVRPFFREFLPSLWFFVLECGGVCAAFLGLVVLVPEVVETVGRFLASAALGGPRAARLLTIRRIQRKGHELAWAVSGVMLVFALLLALHIVTYALRQEVVAWAEEAIRDKAFVYSRGSDLVPEDRLAKLPPDIVQARFSGRTPWPNSILAVSSAELVALTRGSGPEAEAIAARFGAGKLILSTMMSKRFGVGVGDRVLVGGKTRKAELEVVAVTDLVGYVPTIGPYRNGKTYGLISADDFDLIEGYAPPLGAAIALRGPSGETLDWPALLHGFRRVHGIMVEVGVRSEAQRLRETDKDFAIFDVILLLTGVLAAIGIANSLVLSAHSRRREIALYRVLGMEVRQVRALFLMEGAFIGLLGGTLSVVLGIALGFGAIGALRAVSAFDVSFELPPMYAVNAIVGAVVVSVVSAIYPARRASRLAGAESVHYE